MSSARVLDVAGRALLTAALLGGAIAVHEIGHLLAAQCCDIGVEEVRRRVC